jgi:hypothetical protein
MKPSILIFFELPSEQNVQTGQGFFPRMDSTHTIFTQGLGLGLGLESESKKI